MLGHFQRAADGLGLPLSYVISTGNEAGLEGTDFVEFLADDRSTRVIALYCEQIRRPAEFLAACRRARAAGKPIVLMQAGRGAKARKAAQSHTGALIGDFATMRTQVEDAGAIVVSTMDEMMDLVQILVRYPDPPAKGPGILTASGAYVGLTNDFAEEVGLELPELEPATLKKVERGAARVRQLRQSARRHRRVCAGRRCPWRPRRCSTIRTPECCSSRFRSTPLVRSRASTREWSDSTKPKVMVALGDTWPLGPDVMEAVQREPGGVLAIVGSHDARHRALYPLRPLARPSDARPPPEPIQGLPKLGKGAQPEWLGKKVLAAAGIRVPDGELARTADEAIAVGQAHRLSGGAEGAGRGAVAQDRSGRRHARILPTKARCAPPGTH